MRHAAWAVVCVLAFGGLACGQDLPGDTNEIKTLTVEQAEALAQQEGVLELNGLTDITPKVAEALAKSRGWLDLNGLTEITPEVAEALAKREGWKPGQVWSLSLDGLTEITPEVAEALAKREGWLDLDGLAEITPEVATALAKHEGFLDLNGLKEITPEVAEALAKHDGPLYLNGLTQITPEIAEALAKHKGRLSLDGLAEITPEVATALAKHEDILDLNGLKEITLEVNKILRRNHEAFADVAKSLLGRARSPNATRSEIGQAYVAMQEAVRRNPNDDDLRRTLAEFQIGVGRASDAREHLAVLRERQAKLSPEQAAEQADDIKRIELLLAASYVGTSDDEEAAAIVSKLVGYNLDTREFDPAFDCSSAEADAFVLLAGILESRYENEEAAKQVLDKLVETHPDETRGWLAMTTWHRSHKELDKAAEAVAKALAIDADDVNAIFADFELALAQRDVDRAEATAAKALEFYPDDERSYRAFAAVSLQQGDLAQAEQTLVDGVGRLPRQRSLLLMLTDVLLQEKKLTEAAQSLARIREQYDALSPPVQILEARLLVAEQRWNEAKQLLEEVRPQAMGNPDLVRQVDFYLAQCHAKLNEYDAQLEVNRRVLSDDPTSLAARAGAAQALISAGKVDEALAEFESIAGSLQNPQLARLPQIWYPLLQLRIKSQSARPEAERDWSRVDELLDVLQEAGAVNPIQMALLRAESLIRRGEKKAATDLLEEVAATTADPLAWAGLATLELRTVGPDAAQAVLDRAPEAARTSPPVLLVELQLAAGQPPEKARAVLVGVEKRAESLPDSEMAQVLAKLPPLYLAIGDTAEAEGKYDEAELLYSRALAILDKVLGPEHPDTVTARENLAAMRLEREQAAAE